MRLLARAVVAMAMLAGSPAAAKVADFYGVWTNPAVDASGIARLVVTPGDGQRVDIHLYGRCQPRECDWGRQPARAYSENPASSDVQSIAADFDTGFARKRVILRLAVGGGLRFAVETEFTDKSARNDYASGGGLTYASDWNMAPRVAAAVPVPTQTPAPQPAAPVPVPDVAAPTPVPVPPPSSSNDGWFGSSAPVGIGPRLPEGYEPAPGEDCRPFDPNQTRAAAVDGSWRLGDFSRRLVDFQSDRAAAQTAQIVVGAYHFDEQCFVKGANTTAMYWKRAGAVPKNDMKGQDCVAFDLPVVKVAAEGESWRVVAGAAVLADFGDDRLAADRLLSVIRTYRLNRQCFFSPSHARAQYWLSQ
ncbi:MAG: hypothetical protein WDN03_04230 [Rhizomicrobium sp.]